MGANQSTEQELEIGEHCEDSSKKLSAQENHWGTGDMEVTKTVHGAKANHGLQGRGLKGDHHLEEIPSLKRASSISLTDRRRGPENESPEVQWSPGRATTEAVRPQSRKALQSRKPLDFRNCIMPPRKSLPQAPEAPLASSAAPPKTRKRQSNPGPEGPRKKGIDDTLESYMDLRKSCLAKTDAVEKDGGDDVVEVADRAKRAKRVDDKEKTMGLVRSSLHQQHRIKDSSDRLSNVLSQQSGGDYRAMVDRYNTKQRSAQVTALSQILVEKVEGLDELREIEARLAKVMEDTTYEKINAEEKKNKLTMALYFLSRAQKPKFGLVEKRKELEKKLEEEQKAKEQKGSENCKDLRHTTKHIVQQANNTSRNWSLQQRSTLAGDDDDDASEHSTCLGNRDNRDHRDNGTETGQGTQSLHVDTYKWQYLIFTAENTQALSSTRSHHRHNDDNDDDDNSHRSHATHDTLRSQATALPFSFVTREKANAKLVEITGYDQFEGGMAAVARRNVFEYSPHKLLRAELELVHPTRERRVYWVERRLVDLDRDLTKKQRGSKKWSGARPKLAIYIVECEFATRVATEEQRRVRRRGRRKRRVSPAESTIERGGDYYEREEESDDGDGDGDGDVIVVGAFTGDIELDRLPLAAFTDRRLANEHAGDLFLRHSAVAEAIRGPLDDEWWANYAVPIHREAAAAGGGLYVAQMEAYDMRTRLGYDSLRVTVHAVGDVQGPLNI
ncbi:hypothetical protein AAE478_003443 [Parahypoxylon ruwenzoriense]